MSFDYKVGSGIKTEKEWGKGTEKQEKAEKGAQLEERVEVLKKNLTPNRDEASPAQNLKTNPFIMQYMHLPVPAEEISRKVEMLRAARKAHDNEQAAKLTWELLPSASLFLLPIDMAATIARNKALKERDSALPDQGN